MSGGADTIEHRFVTCGKRRVMVRRAGSGPPVVLLHESPRSSAAFIPMIEALAERFTVIAPDTPGYGGSDPLDMHRPQIADYADALKEVVDGLGLERAALFGRHTGAAIAIEFANRYPAQVSGVVLEGCPAFTPEEMEELVASYLPPFRPVWDGGHVAWLWSRIRDQFSFFPWNRQGPASRLVIDMPRPSILNRIAMDLLLAGDGYRVAYEAAFRYDGAAAAAAARVPAHYMATETDVLFPHLDRLHSLPDNAQIYRLTDAERLTAIGDLLGACAAGGDGHAPLRPGGRRIAHGPPVGRRRRAAAAARGRSAGIHARARPHRRPSGEGAPGRRHRSPRPRPLLPRYGRHDRRRRRVRGPRGGIPWARSDRCRRHQQRRTLGRAPRRAPRGRLRPSGADRPAARPRGLARSSST